MDPKYPTIKKLSSYKEFDTVKTSYPGLLKKYIHDIRNMKLLTREMVRNITNMTHDEKMLIITSQNSVIDSLKSFIDSYDS